MPNLLRRLIPEQRLFLGFLSLCLILLVADYFRTPSIDLPGYRWMMTGLLLLTLSLGVWTLLGGLRAPASVFLALVFFTFTYVALEFNGVFSISVTMLIVLILISVPLVGWGAALAMTAAAIVLLWTLAFLPIPMSVPLPLVQARNLTLIFAGVYLVVWWYSRQLRLGSDRLRQANAELERRVEERTKQVLVSEKLATVGRLAAGLAHELNTPLGAITSAHASAESALKSSLVAAFRRLSGADAHQRQLLDTLVERLLNTPSRLVSSAESRERRRELHTWSLAAGWDVGQRETFCEALAEFPDLTQAEFRALGEDSDWKTSLALVEAVHTLTRSLEVIGRGADKMTLVVKSFQSLSHADVSSAPVELDPAEEFENVLLLLQGRIPATVDVTRHYEKVLARCRTDRLGQVLINLITNALQAMKNHGLLDLSVRPDGAWVVLEVSDSGPGVPETLRERIFEPFFTTKPQGEGNGLGLDVARRICIEESGSLTLIQDSDRTRFVVRLPRA